MSIELMCPMCGAVNAFTADQGGSLGQCGQCHTPLYVPRPEEMPAPALVKRFAGPSRGGAMGWVVAGVAVVLLGVSVLGSGAYFVFFRQPTPVQAQQPTDPFASAQKIKLTVAEPATQEGAIDEANHEAIYKVNAPSNGRIAVLIDRVDDGKLDAILTAFDEKKKEIAQSDADADRRVSQLVFPVKSEQDYFFKVAGGDASTGKFKLTVKHLEKPGSGFDNAQEVRLSKIGLAAQHWKFERDGEEHYFRITSPQAGWMFAEMNSSLGNTVDGVLTAFDDARRQVPGFGRFVRFYVSPGKSYYLKAGTQQKPNLGMARTGDYSINFRLVKTGPDDHGNDFASATKITLDPFSSTASVGGQIESPLDIDFFVLEANKTGNVNLSLFFPGNQLDAFLSTYDASGKFYGLGNSFLAELGKTYYISVTPYNSPLPGRQSTGAYTLNLSMNPGFGQGAVNPTAVYLTSAGAGSTSGQLFNAEDVRWYSFKATKTGHMNVKMSYPASSQLDAALYGYDGTRTQEIGLGNGSNYVDFNVTAGVTYHVKVISMFLPAAFRQRTGAYNLSFYMDGPAGKAEAPKKEVAKDEFSKAEEIFLDATGQASLEGRIDGPADNRYYRFKAKRSGWMQVNGNPPAGSALGAEVNAYNDAKVSVVPVPLALIYFPVTAGKTYYLKFGPMAFPAQGKQNSGAFKLALSNMEVLLDDYGNTFAAAHVLGKPSNLGLTGVHGQIETPQDVDFFRFTAEASGKATISLFSAPAGLQGVLSVYDANENLLAEQARTPQLHPSVNIDVTAGRTYYVKAAAQQGEKVPAGERIGSYFLMVFLPLKAPAKAGANAGKRIFEKNDELTAGDERDANIFATDMPRKVYKLKLTAGKTYQIDMKSTDVDSILRLEDSDGKELAFNDDAPGELTLDSRIVHKADKTGEYRIVATCLKSTTRKQAGKFTLTVAEVEPAGDLAGSKWIGMTYEKQEMVIVFNANGTFSSTYGGVTYNDGNWKLDGASLYMECSNKYCEYRGVVDGNVINLDTWNVTGLKWKTRLERAPK